MVMSARWAEEAPAEQRCRSYMGYPCLVALLLLLLNAAKWVVLATAGLGGACPALDATLLRLGRAVAAGHALLIGCGHLLCSVCVPHCGNRCPFCRNEFSTYARFYGQP